MITYKLGTKIDIFFDKYTKIYHKVHKRLNILVSFVLSLWT